MLHLKLEELLSIVMDFKCSLEIRDRESKKFLQGAHLICIIGLELSRLIPQYKNTTYSDRIKSVFDINISSDVNLLYFSLLPVFA